MDYHEVVAAIDSADNTKSADVDSSPIGGLMNKCGDFNMLYTSQG